MRRHVSSVGASTYQKIKRDIIFGALEPGFKLKLDTLRKRYSASPSTLRETLNRLASDGFVDSPEQRGFFVTPVSKEDLVEISDLRVLLECHALRQSIETGDADWEGDLVAAHHKLHLMEQRMLAGDESEKEAWIRYDWEFHQAMIAACNSRNLLALHAIIYDKFLRYQMLVPTYRGEPVVREHRAIFQATLRRDTDQAAELLEGHIRNGLEHALEAVF